VTAASFRKLALQLPGVFEQAHMGHPDFRVGGKVFATLDYPEPGWAMVSLTPEDQHAFLTQHPRMFTRVKGAWGDRGATSIALRHATVAAVSAALAAAHETRLTRPKRTS